MDMPAITKSPSTQFAMPDDRLYLATRAWIIWLQGLFSTRAPGYHRWSSNSEESEIVITNALPSSSEHRNNRPIISVSRGSAQFAGSSRDSTLSRNFSGDKQTLSDMIATSIMFSCVAKEGVEAQELAYTIFRMVPVFKASIMRLGRIHAIGHNLAVSPETKHGQLVPGSSSPEWRMVNVSAPFYIQDVISLERDFHNIMQAVNLHMGLA